MNLASVQKIVKITPIEGADAIETATVLGWEIVVKKGEYKVGDLGIYIQIDTVVPELPEFEFLRSRDFRVRTIKLKKQISQGLLIPLSTVSRKYHREGEDVTEQVGVKKYSKPENLSSNARKVGVPKTWFGRFKQRFLFTIVFKIFPSLKDIMYPLTRKDFPTELVSKTDEERIQNIPHVLEKYKGKLFVVSEKLDGNSITLINNKKKLRVCSRNNEFLTDDNDWTKVVQDTNFRQYLDILTSFFETDEIIVQGEYIGKPQGNKYKLESNEIRLFNIIVKGKRINQSDFYSICKQHNIPCCPLIEEIRLNHTLEDLLKYAEAKSVLNKQVEREGIVMRCTDDNLSFKVISNKFLLKNNE